MSQFIEMQRCSNRSNTLGDFIARCTPDRCGNRGDLPTLSVTKERAIVFQDERFDACVASKDKSNYIIAPRGYLVQGIHIDESNFGIQNLVDEGIVSPAYKLWKFKNNDAIPELVEYYLRSEMAIKYFQRKFLGATVQRRQVIRKEDFLALPLNLPELDDQMKYYQFYRQADKSKYFS
jgi:type I restriction enzyme S subunit